MSPIISLVRITILKHSEKIRYLLVGGFNTLVDIAILMSLTSLLGINKYYSNLVSSSVAMTVSFFLNRKVTFRDSRTINKKQISIFVGINIIGAWLIQPTVLFLSGLLDISSKISIINNDLELIIDKSLAIGVALIWNYLMYRKFVFANKQ